MKTIFKHPILVLMVIGSLLSIAMKLPQDSEKTIIGKWKWVNLFNPETQDSLGLYLLTMGMAKEVFTEYKEDNTFIEYKNKLDKEGFSETKGEWKLEDNNSTLKLKPKEKWMSSKIIKLSADTLIVEIRSPFQLLMVKQK